MARKEKRPTNELITACLKARNIDKLIEFPQFLMNDWERKVVDFILEYQRKFEEPPSISRLSMDFAEFVPLESDPPLPLLDAYEIELESKRAAFAMREMEKAMGKMRSGEKVPLEDISSIVGKLTMSSSTLERYTTFDRTLYFREGPPCKIGVRLIDAATKGVYPGELMLLIGRLGTGKSTFTQFFMNNWFLNQGKRILCISKEMPPIDVYARLDAMVGHFNPAELRGSEDAETRKSIEGKLRTVKHIVSTVSKGEIIMPVMSVYNIAQIEVLARNTQADVVVIDGMYHLQPSEGSRTLSGWEQVAAASRETKMMALNLKIPVIATTQIKRSAAGVHKDMYDPEDIAYSDALGQDADFIVAIRPLGIPDKTRSELQLIKNRFGSPISTIIDADFNEMSMSEISVSPTTEEE